MHQAIPWVSQENIKKLYDVRLITVTVSIALSLWCVYNDRVVSDDGILYLQAAAYIAEGDWHQAYHTYEWPLYPWLIALVSQITSLSLEYSAHLLNATLTAITVFCFISLVDEMEGDKKLRIAAALAIIIYPGINVYRSYIIRGHGYLAFYLLSLLMFVKFIKQPQFRFAIGWGTAIVIATLFRIEGIVFAFLLPLILMLKQGTPIRMRAIHLIESYTVVLILFVATLAVVILNPDIGTEHLGRLLSPISSFNSFYNEITHGLMQKAAILSDHLLNKHTSHHALTIVIVAILITLFSKIIIRATPLFIVLTAHAIYRKCLFPVIEMKKLWIWLITLNIAILVAFAVPRIVLSGRYTLALSLALMLAVPFSLNKLYEKWQSNHSLPFTKNWVFPVVCVVMLIMAADSLVSFNGSKKDYLKEAGKWIRETRKPEETLFSTSRPLAFYSGSTNRNSVWGGNWKKTKEREWEEMLTMLDKDNWKQYNYLAIQIKRQFPQHKKQLVTVLKMQPVKEFGNKKGDRVLIFKTDGDTAPLP